MKYTDVCGAKTKEEMVARFEALCAEVAAKNGGTPESHREMQMHNVGYFAGYYDNETRVRVQEWLGAAHPVFGSATPTPEEAFRQGHVAGATPGGDRG